MRAETVIWDKLPAGRWIPDAELREILRNDCGIDDHPVAGMVDAWISWLVQGCYIVERDMTPETAPRPRAGISSVIYRGSTAEGSLPPPPAPELVYWKSKIEDIPLEHELQKANADAARQAAEAKAARDANLDARLRELGLIPTDNDNTTSQET
jgi:hypothetical protein